MKTSTMTQAMNQGQIPMIREEVSLTSSIHDERITSMMNQNEQLLDKAFPLAEGSHSDVKSYVIYYSHLLAFRKDGTQTGLANPSQLKGFDGSREDPYSLKMQNEAGIAVELMLH